MRIQKNFNHTARAILLRPILLVALLTCLSGCPAPADTPSESTSAPPADSSPIKSETTSFQISTLLEGLDRPWGLAFLPGNELLITERSGRLRRVRDGVLQKEPLQGVPEVHAHSQGGLLDVLLHPDFAQNRWVYLSYSKAGTNGATTAVSRGRLGEAGLEKVEEIFVADAWSRHNRHFGGRMLFDRQGALYLSIGDRGEMERAQTLTDHAGTLLRLDANGKALPDNPFVGKDGAKPEIYTIGNRNIQGMIEHPESQKIWTHEHGPMGGDELNLIKAGANYGWPLVTYGKNYDGTVISEKTTLEGIEAPVLHWTPSIACSGLAVYTGDQFPEWKGNFFVGALVQTHLRRVVLEGETPTHQEVLLHGLARIRTVMQGPDGFLYLLTDSPQGKLLRIEPTASVLP